MPSSSNLSLKPSTPLALEIGFGLVGEHPLLDWLADICLEGVVLDLQLKVLKDPGTSFGPAKLELRESTLTLFPLTISLSPCE